MSGTTASGRRPKPTLELLKQGTYRADRHGDRMEIAYAKKLPGHLKHLGATARYIYNKIGRMLVANGVLTEADGTILALYAQVWSLWAKASEERDTKGIVQCGLLLEKYGSRLGLSPVDRARIRVETPKETSTPMAELLSGRHSG